jgi:YwiC-like protein
MLSSAAMHTPPPIRLRTIALPVEHGGWGFLAEPVLLGLALVPSFAGCAIGIATVAAFLMRHPAKLYWRNRRRLDLSPRFRLARRFALLYASLAATGFAVAFLLAGWKPLVPFLVLSPLLAAFGAFDLSNQARRLLPELAAPMGLAASAPAIALAGGVAWTPALVLWILLQLRAIPSILYVRARLRLERGKEMSRFPAGAAHLAAVALGIALWQAGLSPLSTWIALLLLLARAVLGLSPYRRPAKAKQVGFSELAFGLGYVFVTVLGYRLEL